MNVAFHAVTSFGISHVAARNLLLSIAAILSNREPFRSRAKP